MAVRESRGRVWPLTTQLSCDRALGNGLLETTCCSPANQPGSATPVSNARSGHPRPSRVSTDELVVGRHQAPRSRPQRLQRPLRHLDICSRYVGWTIAAREDSEIVEALIRSVAQIHGAPAVCSEHLQGVDALG